MSPSPRLIILDFGLTKTLGHRLNFVTGFVRAAADRDLASLVLVPSDADREIVSSLAAVPILPAARVAVLPGEAMERMPGAAKLLAPTWRYLAEKGLGARDIVLMTHPTTPTLGLYDLGRWLSTLSDGAHPAVFIRLLGAETRDPKTGKCGGDAAVLRLIARLLGSVRGQERVFFTVNSRSQLGHLTALLARRAFLMPMPKFYGDEVDVPSAEIESTTVYLHGRVSEDEPFLSKIAAALIARHPDLRIVAKFSGHDRLDRNPAPAPRIPRGLVVVTEDQSTDDYLGMIRKTDIVVLPYRESIYRMVNSGVFCEAAAFGKPTVVPSETWMSEQIESGHAVGLTFGEPTVAAIIEAVEETLRRREQLSTAARERAPLFREEHSCARNLELMLSLAAWAPDMDVDYMTGEPIDFTTALLSRHYLTKGWSFTEEGVGVWTLGDTAELRLRMDVPPGRQLSASVSGNPFIARKHPKTSIAVSVNGVPIDEWTFSVRDERVLPFRERKPAVRHTTIPDGVVNDAEVRIVFQVRNPVSPRELGISDDARQLGFMLKTLTISGV